MARKTHPVKQVVKTVKVEMKRALHDAPRGDNYFLKEENKIRGPIVRKKECS